MKTTLLAGAALAAFGLAGQAGAKVLTYSAALKDISGLGGSGTAIVKYKTQTDTLSVDIMGTGFAPNMLHVQHIHGNVDANGNAIDAVSPTLANDTDGDGVVELNEGAAVYGGILLQLYDETNTGNGFSGFPAVTDTANGSFSFSATYDLATTGALFPGVSASALFPLDKREIVIHGAYLAPGIGGIGNEAPDNALLQFGGYSNFVPVAAGELVKVSSVPLPAGGLLLLSGLAGLGGLMTRRRRKAG